METSIVDMDGIKFEYFLIDNMARDSVGKHKQWESHITNFVKSYNNFYNIRNIIDVGANFGYHTLLFSKEVEENVYAFEPQIQNFQLLQNNVKHNNITNIKLYNVACGDMNCEIKMPIIYNTTYHINMGDFTPNFVDNNSFSITESVLLDEINLPQIDLIKIDVQGWEKKVLIGSNNILQKYKPVLIVEFEEHQLVKTNTSCQELFEFIRNNNYYIFYLDYQWPSDHICVHNDKLDDFRNKFHKYISNHNVDNGVNHNINYGISEKIVI